jgi:hypothetical protein
MVAREKRGSSRSSSGRRCCAREQDRRRDEGQYDRRAPRVLSDLQEVLA